MAPIWGRVMAAGNHHKSEAGEFSVHDHVVVMQAEHVDQREDSFTLRSVSKIGPGECAVRPRTQLLVSRVPAPCGLL